MRYVCLLLLFCGASIASSSAQSDLGEVLDGFGIELDDDTAERLGDWIRSIDDLQFNWSEDISAKERKKWSRRYEELLSLRSTTGRQIWLYGGRTKGSGELLLVAQLDASFLRLTLTGDFDFR